MNTLLSLPFARPIIYVGGLLAAFALGVQVARNTFAMRLQDTESVKQVNGSSAALLKPGDAPKTQRPKAVDDEKRTPGRLVVTSPNSRLASLIEYASKLDAEQTLAALRKLDLQPDHPESKLARHVLVARYAELDPLTALTYVDTLKGDEYAVQKINAFGAWASRDGAKAAEFFSENAVNGGLVNEDDVGAAAAIAKEWAQRDAIAAWRWVAALPSDARGEAVREVARHLAATNPTLAMQAVASLPEAWERAEAMTPLATQWAQVAPSRTAEWVATLRDPAEQSSAATGLVAAWMQSNPYAVSEWVSSLKTGPTRDAAIKTMIRAQAVRNDPETATYWAAVVQDEALRSELVAETVKRWEQHDPEAAQRWLAGQ